MISPTFEILGITFHLYGLIIGLSIISATTLIEKEYKKLGYLEDCFWKIGLVSLVFGVIGARLWHVSTDFHLYKNNLTQILYIWNGGLSILGGVLGGIIGIKLALKYLVDCKKLKAFELLDIAIFGLPVAQVIGRVGNYINQELYGKPTDFVLKIFISPENRLSGFESYQYYHPLFLYEMLAMSLFTIVLYYLKQKDKLFKIGSGLIFLSYVLYYSTVRFFLEFIRLDKALIANNSIGVNQFILFSSFIISGIFIFKIRISNEK